MISTRFQYSLLAVLIQCLALLLSPDSWSAITPAEDTTLQALIDSAPAGATLHLPRGDFYLGRALEIPAGKPLTLIGYAVHDGSAAVGTTRLRAHPNFFLPERAAKNTALIRVQGSNFFLSEVGLIGTSTISSPDCGIRFEGGSNLVLRDTMFQSFTKLDSAALCGFVGKEVGIFHTLTSNVFRSMDLTGPNQEIRILGGSMNGPRGLRLAGYVHISDVDFEGGSGTKAPLLELLTPAGQATPSNLVFERNYLETAPTICDLTLYPEIVALDLQGSAFIHDNQFHMKKFSGTGAATITCPDIRGIAIKTRTPELPIQASGNAIFGFDRSVSWDTTVQNSVRFMEKLNIWGNSTNLTTLAPQPDGSRSYPTGDGYSGFGPGGLRANANMGLKTLRLQMPATSSDLPLNLTEANVFEIATSAANQSVSLPQPPASANTAVLQKAWRVVNRIPGSFVVILNSASSPHPLTLNPAHFNKAATLAPGVSQLFVVDSQGLLNPVGR